MSDLTPDTPALPPTALTPGAPPDFVARAETLPENPPRHTDPLLWIWIGGLVIAAAVDVPMAIPAFNRVLGGSPALSLLCAVGFAVITLLAAFSSGREARRGNVAGALAASTAVGALIAGLFLIRILAAREAAGSALTGLEGAVETAEHDEVPIAIGMGLFVLASAILAWVEGYVLTDSPRTSALRKIARGILGHEENLEIFVAQEARHKEDLATKAHALAGIPHQLDAARQGLDAFEKELQELARAEYARHLGDPSATSNLDLPLPRP